MMSSSSMFMAAAIVFTAGCLTLDREKRRGDTCDCSALLAEIAALRTRIALMQTNPTDSAADPMTARPGDAD